LEGYKRVKTTSALWIFMTKEEIKLTQVLQIWKKETGGLQVIKLTHRFYYSRR
jgi:hypothetical protein